MYNTFHKKFLENFVHTPTKNQKSVIQEITDFVLSDVKKRLFVLKGYAGTGKTSLVGALVKTLPTFNFESILMAPTGRAAKVLANYSGKPGFTIHKLIYQLKKEADGRVKFVVRENKFQNTFFIVDEASMIGSDGGLNRRNWNGEVVSLLDDLMSFVYSGRNCQLILIGDTAQLPPVGMDISPALNLKTLNDLYCFEVQSVNLIEVVRQEAESEILKNATYLRNKINNDDVKLPLFLSINHADIWNINGADLEDYLNQANDKYGAENVMVITRSNKRANLFNLQIRARIKWLEDRISAGDYMMIIRNNYYWLSDDKNIGFIANGDIVELLKIQKYEECYGFSFADVTIKLLDYPDAPSKEVKILLNGLLVDGATLPMDEQRKLYENVMEDYIDQPSKSKRNELVRTNPYYQALHVKFAYAVTCHKSQGGQWDAVFVDQGYITDDMINKEYLRWLYTSITRAKQEVFLVNFKSQFFGNDYLD